MTECHTISDNSTNNTTNNSPTTINLNLNMNLNFYGNENIDHITSNPEYLLDCLKTVASHGIPDLIEKIHLNKDVPENHNVEFQREHKPSKMKVYKDVNGTPEWVVRDGKTVIDELITKGRRIIENGNKQHLVLSSNPTLDEKELFDHRFQKLSDVSSKKKGVYCPIRNEVLNKFKNDKQRRKISRKTADRQQVTPESAPV
jgi:hypothetical protein